MVEKGIRVFKDNEELQVGQKIGGNLLQALDNTQIYIPIFSKGFVSSVWCLREVAHMVDCTLKSDGKKEILPIFFDVKPVDVKLITELYSNVLSEYEKKYGPAEVTLWKAALREVATRAGWERKGEEYGELIKLIVREVLLKLKVKSRDLPYHLVEVDDQKDIEKLLDVDFDGIRFVIIHGTGGIGKSTLAKVIFNRFLPKFNYSSFLEVVQHQDLLEVQKKLLSDTLGLTSADGIHDTHDGIHRIRNGLSDKKVLVVVDNVDEKRQLESLAGSCDWFGSGSRIMVTVRDIRVVLNDDKQMRPGNYLAHSVNEMSLYRAIQLFSKHAFRSDTPPENCYDFSKEVVLSIGRLPLTLEVVGSLFAGMNRPKWDKTLDDLKQGPPNNVRESLMISINKLNTIEKAIFLDIACFCIGEDNTYVDYMWRSSNHSPRSAIDVLLLMSLIKIDGHNCFWMHDEVRDLGRYIVKEENFEDAGKRRWMWIDENTLDILRSDEEKGAVRALSLGISHDLTSKEIAYLPKLRFLGGQGLNFVGDFKNVRPNLRWLSWHDCSWEFSATNLYLENLVVLDLSGSNITYDWGGWRQIKELPDSIGEIESLVKLDLRLLKIFVLPDSIGRLKNLKHLFLSDCKNMLQLPESIGELESLVKLDLESSGISVLPYSIGKLKNLNHLLLSYCKNMLLLPESIGELESLVKLDLESSGISVLPYSIGKLKNLNRLLLSNCKNMLQLLESIGELESLLPESIEELESLVELDLNYSGISVLPYSIGKFKNLNRLFLSNCKNILQLPESIGELESLVELNLSCSGIFVLPDSIGALKNLNRLLLSRCKNLHKLPDSIGKLESMVELDLTFSGISVLPNSIGKLKNLKTFI
ncbi:disease resistance protein RUN1-like [Eucalyptus grandis]|uniref:disease resistance protein RUN1-like n=1 Tax=Eucalyptus grandis TaxID=71139 RepID=UPI00192ED3FA|nr:disease resistance protein RUN1-like [Eucalyptus grandis]